jgi:alpha-ketoglutarate-dependent taurine dioxygenase
MSLLTIERLKDTVGAEVVGLDVDRLAADDTLAGAVLDALEENGVLVFRGLHLDPQAQVAFCTRLGEVDFEEGHHPVRGIYRITLNASKRPNADLMKATFLWHMDGCTPLHDEAPQKATMLSAVAVAASGGETEFASTYAAYESLAEDEKQRFADLRVVHSLEASQRRTFPDPTPEQVAKWRARPSKEHPLVWTHESGRKSLVIGSSTDHVVGMDRDEGRALLHDLVVRATRPELVYRHEWGVGDTVIWDNHGLVHRAMPYAPDSDREMLRTTVLGTEKIS